ncbi:DUF2786 domain-containing protein [Wielerella bovis]|uniref:DUF2786 domain-containing protein n=1 Tax=Wielerella bovis TaxID=2917790 RepID=UPI002019D78E|nr:DUF2786 domain-containing protein [Wielerella bovis]MCG7655910.1 DUF2786 domain-containing protein [Wielerella bovis]MCG7656892.1 DUF2786 domain-containing protein [Wielerella bovis]MCG7658099.1 DUF2786 domain-containing protein [Wielerella bovis]MCG7658173.1 DUF2786 domain-containing protein [Wielerella bovis]MCG7659115.1 DUF2786 domain-containing protein [Wielerella bovis]
MSVNKQKILAKIKKCLALSQSANEHGAAQALKHAQALMREHQISSDDLALANIEECGIKCANQLPAWQQALATLCGLALGAKVYTKGYHNAMQIKFYGLNGRAEMAAYAYEVLLRQVRKERRHYLKTHLNHVRKASNKTYRADEFCNGWVNAVWQKLQEFALSPQETDLMNQYHKQLGEMKTAKPRSVRVKGISSVSRALDRWRGKIAGEKAELHRGVDGAAQVKQLGVSV